MEHVKTPKVQGISNICTGKETVSITGSEETQHNGKKKFREEGMEESKAKINKPPQGCRAASPNQPCLICPFLSFYHAELAPSTVYRDSEDAIKAVISCLIASIIFSAMGRSRRVSGAKRPKSSRSSRTAASTSIVGCSKRRFVLVSSACHSSGYTG